MTDALPNAFENLEPLCDAFGGLWFHHEIMDRIDKLSPDELDALSQAYSEIRRNNQVQPLTDWVNQIDRKHTTSRELHLNRGAFVLLTVFEELGEKGILPFSDVVVRYARKFPPRDWSRVPAEYQFLGALADQYGIMLYEKGWDETLASISRNVRAKMERAGKDLKEWNRVQAVQDWMNTQPESNVEVTALDGLLQLLDNFGML